MKNNKHPNNKLQNSWNKYGEENFKFEVLKETSEDELLIFENKIYKETKPYYNLSPVIMSGVKKNPYKNALYFTKKDIKNIRNLYINNNTMLEISKIYNTTLHNIFNIVSNRTFYDKSYKYICKKSKLSDYKVNLIRCLINNNYSLNSISKYAECDWNAVKNIKTNKTYKNVSFENIDLTKIITNNTLIKLK